MSSSESGSDNFFDTTMSELAEFPCTKCGLEVTDKHKSAIMCDICQNFQHKNCFSTRREYDMAVKDELWICTDSCLGELPVEKEVITSQKNITEPGALALFKMMKGVIVSGARNNHLHKQDYSKLTTRVEKLEKNVNDFEEKVEGQFLESKQKVDKLSDKTAKEVKELQKQLERLTDEKNSRTAILIGPKITEGGNFSRNLSGYFLKFGIQVNFIKSFVIKKRATVQNNPPSVGSRPIATSSPILVEFRSLEEKVFFCEDIKRVKNANNREMNVQVREFLSAKKQELLAEAKLALRDYFEYIWPKNGRIYVKKNSEVTGIRENPILITDSDMINHLVRESEMAAEQLFMIVERELRVVFKNIFLANGKVFVSNSPEENVRDAKWIKNLEDLQSMQSQTSAAAE